MTQFNETYIAELFAANYFGDEPDASEIAKLWMEEMPYNKGDEIDEDDEDFDAACQKALAASLTRFMKYN